MVGKAVFVELEETYRPSLVLHKIATALEISFVSETTLLRQIIKCIENQPHLLVLDGIDHVLFAIPDLLEQLQTACQSSSFVTTSVQKLPSTSIYHLRLEGLEFPTPFERVEEVVRYDAVRLLEKLARRMDSTFQIKARECEYVASIVNTVEGSPLALQLIASRMGVLSPKQILSRLNDDSLGFLVDRSDSSQSIQVALSIAYSTLDPWAMLLLNRLWVFEGAFDAERAQSVCAYGELPKDSILDALQDLFEASLISPSSRGTSTKAFRLSKVVRDFARAKNSISEQKTLRARVVSNLAEIESANWAKGLASSLETIELFDLCYEDLRRTWFDDIDSQQKAQRVVDTLCNCSNYWFQKMQYEEALAVVLAVAENPFVSRSKKYPSVLNLGAWFALKQGRFADTRNLIRIGIAAAIKGGTALELGKLLNACSAYYKELGRPRAAVKCSKLAISLIPEPEHQAIRRTIESNLAGLLVATGKYGEAEKLLSSQLQSLDTKSWFGVSYHVNWAHLRAAQRKWQEASTHLQTACDFSKSFPYEDQLPTLYLNACEIALGQNRFVDLANLANAVRSISDFYGLTLSPTRQRELDAYLDAFSTSEVDLGESWRSESPHSLLEDFLQHW